MIQWGKQISKCVLALMTIFFVSMVYAQPPNNDPHPKVGAGMPHPGDQETGIITGHVLFKNKEGKENPVANQNVALLIFKEGAQILVLEKTTDQKGEFVFKNIFKDPAYAYALGTVYQKAVYMVPQIHLHADENERKVHFAIGEGSTYLIPDEVVEQAQSNPPHPGMAPGMAPPVAGKKTPFTVGSTWSSSYQTIAWIFSGLVVLAAIYFVVARKKSS